MAPHYHPQRGRRPGAVTGVRGVIVQSDGASIVGRVFIRPLEALDRWIVGIQPSPGDRPLAMHAGIHVVVDGRYDYVAEQLIGRLDLDFRSGLNWTPLAVFRARNRGGWDATLPVTEFRSIGAADVEHTIRRLNVIEGRPFVGEDCTAFVERAFGGQRMFADSPLLRWFGIGVRIGDPALPLLRRDASLASRTNAYVRGDALRNLPDALANAEAPNARIWLIRAALIAAIAFGGYRLLAPR